MTGCNNGLAGDHIGRGIGGTCPTIERRRPPCGQTDDSFWWLASHCDVAGLQPRLRSANTSRTTLRRNARMRSWPGPFSRRPAVHDEMRRGRLPVGARRNRAGSRPFGALLRGRLTKLATCERPGRLQCTNFRPAARAGCEGPHTEWSDFARIRRSGDREDRIPRDAEFSVRYWVEIRALLYPRSGSVIAVTFAVTGLVRRCVCVARP